MSYYGYDTDRLTQRIAECKDTLNISFLNIEYLPELPDTITELMCYQTTFKYTITQLPPNLKKVYML